MTIFRTISRTPSIFDKVEVLFWRICHCGHRGAACILTLLDRGVSAWTSRISPALIMGLIAALVGPLFVAAAVYGLDGFSWIMSPAVELSSANMKVLKASEVNSDFMRWVVAGIGLYLSALSLVGILRIKAMLWLQKAGVAGGILALGYLFFFMIDALGVLRAHSRIGKEVIFDKYAYHSMFVWGSWLTVFGAILLFWYAVTLAHRRSYEYYTHESGSGVKGWGDRVVEDIRNGGEDPRYKEATRWSIWWHIFILFILPLLSFRWMKPYEIPEGSGVQAPQVVKVVKRERKPQDQLIFNPNSAISYIRPKPEDSNIIEQLMAETENTYETTSLQSGKLGKGGGKKGGWPNGMENARVRFIRLEYAGGDWDQQMGKGADYNFLLEFQKRTGFNIWKETESVRISDLKKFPKKKAPPFVYLTGSGGMSLTAREIKTLRWYLEEEGGMIFADNGGGSFNSSFRNVMARVLPGNTWIDIANDDIMYRQPFVFPKGAPPLWHHSGSRALGIKNDEGRWLVFYHQGDINDAWQDGNSGVSKAIRAEAFKMGINVVNYSFNQYLSIHYEE